MSFRSKTFAFPKLPILLTVGCRKKLIALSFLSFILLLGLSGQEWPVGSFSEDTEYLVVTF